MCTVKEICSEIESFAPLSLQESWDNSGLQVGDPEQSVRAVLLTLDITEEVLNEAIDLQCDLIISHHPLLFHPLKRISPYNVTEGLIYKAIQHHISIYSAHTNLDSVRGGVSTELAAKLHLEGIEILIPRQEYLFKVVVMIPENYSEKVSKAMFEAGAGRLGYYDQCGFQSDGTGSFRSLEGSNPFTGELNTLHKEREIRFETLAASHNLQEVIHAMRENHPYEKPAYDLIALKNNFEDAGTGAIGYLQQPVSEEAFLSQLKEVFSLPVVRYSRLTGKKIRKIAVCGGSGSSFTRQAISAGADAFVSADFKSHNFAGCEKEILMADIGHYESEQHTKEIFHKILTKKKHNFAVHISKINTNSINHLI